MAIFQEGNFLLDLVLDVLLFDREGHVSASFAEDLEHWHFAAAGLFSENWVLPVYWLLVVVGLNGR